MAKPKNLKLKVGLSIGITTSVAILTGFMVYLGHKLMSTFFEKIVKAMGIQGDFMPIIIVALAVLFLIALLAGIMIFVLHKRFNMFKQLGKIYGVK